MNDETQITSKPKADHSQIFNVSVRAWIALIVVGTVCTMSIAATKVEEPLYTLVGMVVGFYFAQNQKPKTQSP